MIVRSWKGLLIPFFTIAAGASSYSLVHADTTDLDEFLNGLDKGVSAELLPLQLEFYPFPDAAVFTGQDLFKLDDMNFQLLAQLQPNIVGPADCATGIEGDISPQYLCVPREIEGGMPYPFEPQPTPAPSSPMETTPATEGQDIDPETWYRPSNYRGNGFWRDRATWGLSFTVSFTEMAQLQLGESIWTQLEVGTGNSNDFRIPSLGLNPGRRGTSLIISARQDNEPIFTYLDYQGGGLGTCVGLSPENESELDRSYPESDVNRCIQEDQTDFGEADRLYISSGSDLWVREIVFLPGQEPGSNLEDKLVGIQNTNFHLQTISDDEEQVHFWRPPKPYFVPAGTTLTISRVEADFQVARISLFEETEPAENTFGLAALQDSSQEPAKVPEPRTWILITLGVLGLILVRRKQLTQLATSTNKVSGNQNQG